MKKNIETFIGCDCEYDKAKMVLFGAPFDSTTSFRPGARFGSSAIRHESYGLEVYSPYQDRELTEFEVFDSGDLELCIGDTNKVLDQIQEHASRILQDKKIPLLIGGEHLVTLGAVRAAVEQWKDLHIIHFDAHADLRSDYLGVELSHACVMRRGYELVGDNKIHQFCIRSGDKEEFTFANQHTEMHKFNFDGLQELIQKLKEENVPVYFTIDLDCLDPAAFPGTGTPEAGGVTFVELLEAIELVAKTRIVAADINELAPMLDASGCSTAVACKVLRELIIAILKNNEVDSK